MRERKLTKQELTDLRTILTERLQAYKGDKHINLNIEPVLLEQIIFEEKISKLIFLEKLFQGYTKTAAISYAKYKAFAIDFDLLKKIDFTGVSFKEVDITGRDFTGSKGVKIEPIYTFVGALTGATLTDTEITGSLDGCFINGTNFEGSKGAKINPQKVPGRDLSYATLIDVEITGPLDNCNIKGTIFDEKTNVDDLYKVETKRLVKNINDAFNTPYKEIEE